MEGFKLLRGFKFKPISNWVMDNVFSDTTISNLTFSGATFFPTPILSINTRVIHYHFRQHINSIVCLWYVDIPNNPNRYCFHGTMSAFAARFIFDTRTTLKFLEIHGPDGNVYRYNDPMPVFNENEVLLIMLTE